MIGAAPDEIGVVEIPQVEQQWSACLHPEASFGPRLSRLGLRRLLNGWRNQRHGRTTAKCRTPARGPWQVIDSRLVVTGEHRRPAQGRGVALEIDCRHRGAPAERTVPNTGDAVGDRDAGQAAGTERPLPDAGDAVGDRDAGQAGAELERIVPDAGDTVGDRDAGQVGAVRKRRVPNAGDAVGDRVGSDYAPRVLNERGLALVEQDPIHTAIEAIEGIHRDCGQAGAARECSNPDGSDVVTYREVGQAGAPAERIVPDAGDAVGNRNAAQPGAPIERTVPDAGDRQAICRVWNPIWNGHIAPRTAVIGDSNAVVCGRVIPGAVTVRVRLALHHGGQRQ